MADKSIMASTCGPTVLADQNPIIPENYEKDLFNDMGFVLRARSDEGHDIHLWMFMYRQLGEAVIIDNEVCQTLLVKVAFTDEEKKTMHDAPFINKGQNIDDYNEVGTMGFTSSESKVSWSLNGRVFESQPPNWHVKGGHAGVLVDLHFSQRGQAFYHCGEFSNIKNDEGIAGFVVHCRATGTVTVQDKLYTISDGHGVHERIVMGGLVPDRLSSMAGRGSNWLHGWGKSFSFYTLTRDVSQSSTFMLNIDGETLASVGEDVSITEAEHWLDPKTNQMNPRKWRLRATTAKGRLEAVVTAYGRAYYTWIRRGGTLLVHQFVADCEARFTFADGTILEEKQMVASLEYMRTLYHQKS
ncbi:hypothetical protein PENARI_c005G11140 [Penicillium arizonense]|uniref:AttH domain-containing protein n=1 Tax=Penicillium arizonense TaxID=1835702 RepID=A0A1F5LNW6_PENAI|nr:hypothetical protein PENARI_c005G11140 [Penicillium arizonense]OGE54720.1 hypothetical protein PENARI_c005G11140 [Penicillium arizonense]